MKGLLKILTWILIAAWFVVVLGFVSGEADKVVCNRIDVELTDTALSRFVTVPDIREMLSSSGIPLQGYTMSQIDSRNLERTLEENPYIGNAEVSKDISGRLEVMVEQRVPLVRIMPDGRSGFYLDREGHRLPLSEHFTPKTLLVSGHVNDQEAEGGHQLQEILEFSTYLSDHPFWKAQIVQIYVDRRGEYELIPRVGAHQILLGSMDHWEQKLRNLELLYRQGLSRYGWNTYETINLKYTNQVICSKR
ncbi:MAG: cell division protein FtsQ/DivIB [Bacteroidales bacterium]